MVNPGRKHDAERDTGLVSYGSDSQTLTYFYPRVYEVYRRVYILLCCCCCWHGSFNQTWH
jgi:hypothetical protein